MVSFTASPRASSISAADSGSSSSMSLARRRFTASATRCCWAPSWRLRSILRRSASPVATMRAREACRSSLARLQVLEALLEGGVELHVVEREAHLAGQLGEHAVVLLGELVAVVGPLDHEQAEQLARSARPGATRSCGGGRPSSSAGQPHLEPGVAGDAGARDDRLLLGPEHERRRPTGRAPTRPARGGRRSRSRSRRGAAPAPCAATRPAGAGARPSGSSG